MQTQHHKILVNSYFPIYGMDKWVQKQFKWWLKSRKIMPISHIEWPCLSRWVDSGTAVAANQRKDKRPFFFAIALFCFERCVRKWLHKASLSLLSPVRTANCRYGTDRALQLCIIMRPKRGGGWISCCGWGSRRTWGTHLQWCVRRLISSGASLLLF